MGSFLNSFQVVILTLKLDVILYTQPTSVPHKKIMKKSQKNIVAVLLTLTNTKIHNLFLGRLILAEIVFPPSACLDSLHEPLRCSIRNVLMSFSM